MKLNNCIIYIILFAVISCVNNKSKVIPLDKMTQIEILDSVIIEKISNYSMQYLNNVDYEHVIMLNIIEHQDKTILEVYYEMNLSAIAKQLPKFYSKLGGTVVLINNNSFKSVIISETLTDSLLKSTFKTQFNYYSQNGEYPPPINFGSVKWTILDGELIKVGWH